MIATIGVDDPFFDSLPADSWTPVNLEPVADGFDSGETVGPAPRLLHRDDGISLIYPGEVHSISGEPETGKSWLMLALAGELVESGEHVLFIDFEDGAAAIYARLRALGASREAVLARFDYVRPEEPPSKEALERFAFAGYALIVLDGISEAYSLLGLNINDNRDAATFLQQVVRPLAAGGAPVVQIDHVVKAQGERGRWAIGAQHKTAGVAVAYTVEVIKAPSRHREGLLRMRVAKDRHGHVRGHAEGKVIADVRIIPTDGGACVAVQVQAPEPSTGDDGGFRPTVLMQRVADYLDQHSGAGTREIRDGVQDDSGYLLVALQRLIQEGYVEAHEHGQGRTKEHHLVKPFLG